MRGPWRHMLVLGVVSWGIPMFIIMTFVVNRSSELTAKSVLMAAAIWLLGGLGFGALTWHFSERRYRRLTSRGT